MLLSERNPLKSRQRTIMCMVLGFLVMALVVPTWTRAEEPSQLEAIQKTLDSKSIELDTVWTMVAAFLVMWMQAGFAAVEAGLTRPKNAVNIMMKNLLDFCFGALCFWAVGFGLMFSEGNPYIGMSGFFLQEHALESSTNFKSLEWTKVPLECKYFFQMVFCATAATIVSGAMAERTKFTTYMLYSIGVSALIYPISGHWIWGGGWLSSMGFFDFAGSTVVHSCGGWIALVGASMIGPRLGKYAADGTPKAIPGHNLPLATIGVFILWLGWFGFNPGSTMAAAGKDIAHIATTTNTAAAAGCLAALFVSRFLFGKWDASMTLNGALAGLVAITAPCMWVTVPASLVIGAVGGVLVVFSCVGVERYLKVDDPVGAISVHGVCGAWGTLALGLFSTANGESAPKLGLLYGGGIEQLTIQAIGVGAVLAWCIASSALLFGALKYTVGLRVSEAEEIEGLDKGEHGNEAYHGFVTTT